MFEHIGAASAVEKMGWLSLIGGFFLTFYKVVRWLSRLEQAIELLREERTEMLEQMKGLRQDITAIMLNRRD